MARRTTHRSSRGTKLYAVRDRSGRFKDIQTYKRAHGQDLKRKSKPEASKKTAVKKKKTTVKKQTAKTPTARKTTKAKAKKR